MQKMTEIGRHWYKKTIIESCEKYGAYVVMAEIVESIFEVEENPYLDFALAAEGNRPRATSDQLVVRFCTENGLRLRFGYKNSFGKSSHLDYIFELDVKPCLICWVRNTPKTDNHLPRCHYANPELYAKSKENHEWYQNGTDFYKAHLEDVHHQTYVASVSGILSRPIEFADEDEATARVWNRLGMFSDICNPSNKKGLM